MKIKKVTEKIGNDFWANMECEHCGHEQKLSSGYDDSYYHDNVIPKQKCQSCGKDRSGKKE